MPDGIPLTNGSQIRRAGPGDLALLLELVREFYAVDRHVYREDCLRESIPPLLADDTHGVIWLLGEPVDGYAVITWGYSLESCGRDALIDEIFVRNREAGLGSQALRQISDDCRRRGMKRMFLETESHNERVRAFYARAGFEVDDSVWMSMRLQ